MMANSILMNRALIPDVGDKVINGGNKNNTMMNIYKLMKAKTR